MKRDFHEEIVKRYFNIASALFLQWSCLRNYIGSPRYQSSGNPLWLEHLLSNLYRHDTVAAAMKCTFFVTQSKPR